MPGFRLPQVERAPEAAPESVGRLQIQAPDLTRGMAAGQKAVEGVGKEAVELFDKIEDDEVKAVATRAGVEYEGRIKTQLKEAQQYKGDPADKYATMEADWQKVADDVSAKYGKDAKTMRAIKERTDKVFSFQYDNLLTSQAIQSNTYHKDLADESVALRKNYAPVTYQNITSKDVVGVTDGTKLNEVFSKFDQNLQDMMDTRLNEGTRTGAYNPNAEAGKSKMMPSLTVQIMKDTSESVRDAVMTLTRSGQVDVADAMLARYRDRLLPKDAESLFKTTQDKRTKMEALGELDKARRKFNDDPEEVAAYADTIKDLGVREAFQKSADDHFRRQKNITKQKNYRAFESLSSTIRDMKENERPVSVNDMLNNPDFETLAIDYQNMNERQKKAIDQSIEVPKNSTAASQISMFQNMFSGKYKGMDPATFRESLIGLNSHDRTAAENKYKSENNESESEANQKLNYVSRNLESELVRAKVVKPEFGGKLGTEARREKAEIFNMWVNHIPELPKNITTPDLQKELYRFVNQYAKDKAANGGKAPVVLQTAPSPTPTPSPTPSGTPPPDKKTATTTVTPKDMMYYANLYVSDHNGNAPPAGFNMRSWIAAQKQQGR